jgi:hypothetical protein
MLKKNIKGKAWVIDVNMGYGHQRTAYPLKDLAPNKEIISANDYKDMPKKDKAIWDSSRNFYEFISKFQKILNFYPKRDLSSPNLYSKQVFGLIKKGWGKDLIKKLSKNPLPLISTFFIPAFMAEAFNYPGEIYCVICDADISRSWAPFDPFKSRIKYFAPNFRVMERLMFYGIKKENIFLVGYPLPKENIKNASKDLAYRILNLDTRKRYQRKYKPLIKAFLGNLPKKSNHPFAITFAVGGAGAQKEIAIKILKTLSSKIKNKTIKIFLIAGVRKEVKRYFLENIKRLGLEYNLNKNLEIVYEKNIKDYFKKFNQVLRKTDILWTKPSELSFYTALGLPIILSPTVGSQEDFNEEWLLNLGSAMHQKDLNYIDQWLLDFMDSGWLAEASMQGFIEAKKMGTYEIEKIISKKK